MNNQGQNQSASALAQELAHVESQLQQIESQIENLLHRQQSLQDSRSRLQRLVAADARAPRVADWAAASFPWDTQVQTLLQSVFNLNSWRPLQREIINATLQGRDALALLPAGGGKSLCYQLPALVDPQGHVTLVVSPLLALIVDQVGHLQKLNISVSALTSLSSKEELNQVLKSLDQADTTPRLLYCTPERIASSKRFIAKLEKLYKGNRLSRIAIDESHCASAWGNDFRPDYRKLGVLRQQFPNVPILALTATATASVCKDITSILQIDGAEIFRNSIDRPNLFYEVKPKPATATELLNDIASWIKGNFPNGESGIVYCLTRKDTESTAEELSQRGIACAAYHADLDPAVRMSCHTSWAEGTLQVVVATIAFGMGISKADVRFVVHHTMSKSTENYYQESGRAGRDGLPATCRLYYRFSDYLRQAAVVSMETNWAVHLLGMLNYCASSGASGSGGGSGAGSGSGGSAGGCRRGIMCRHFAEAPAPCDAMCDYCLRVKNATTNNKSGGSAGGSGGGGSTANGLLPRIDVSEACKTAIEVLKTWPATDKRATLTQLIDKWIKTHPCGGSGGGSGSGAVAEETKINKKKDKLSKDECERMVEVMVLSDILRLDFGFTAYATNVYLKIGPAATSVVEGRRKVEMVVVPLSAGDSGGSSSRIDVAMKPGNTGTNFNTSNAGAGGSNGGEGSGKRRQVAAVEAAAVAAEERNKKSKPEPEVVNILDDTDDDDFV
jgi:ATP-dependent DNA helicase Q1